MELMLGDRFAAAQMGQGGFMRLLIIGLLGSGLAVGGCNRSNTVPASQFSTDATRPADPGVPVATGGTKAPIAATTPPPTPAPASAAAAVTWREITIPAGTHLPIALDTAVGSDTSRAEEPVHAHIARALTIGGQTVLTADS